MISTERNHPIPPPNHPRQYRAIGLVYGQYYPSETHLTRGVLTTEEGVLVEAVLLGKMMSVIKNHLDLSKPHLWVVYPRMRDEDDHLHFQLAGVWEPSTLHPQARPALASDQPPPESQQGQFSIRGEVIFADRERELIILKIRQSPRPSSSTDQTTTFQRPKCFKIKLKGILSERPLGHFWDLKVKLQRDTLIIQAAKDLGFVLTKRLPLQTSKPYRKSQGDNSRSFPRRDRQISLRPEDKRPALPSRKPLPKPMKRDQKP